MERVIKKDIKGAGAYVLIKGHKCHRCAHEWRPKNMKVVPIACPDCHSPYWKKQRRRKKDSAKA